MRRSSVSGQRDLYIWIADRERVEGRFIHIDGKKLVNFGSCSYLGLETDERLVAEAYRAMLDCGTQFSTSRAYVSAPLYEELQALLSRIVGDRPIAVGSTTTLLHAAALPTVIEAEDTVIYDAQVHNSVQSVLPTLAAHGRAREGRGSQRSRGGGAAVERRQLRAASSTSATPCTACSATRCR